MTKSAWLLLLLMTLYTPASFSQGKDAPYPGCGTITIETRLPGAAAFSSWSGYIEREGIRLDRTDPIFFQLNTLPITMKKSNCEYFIESSVNDRGDIRIQMKWKKLVADSTQQGSPDYQKWAYDPAKKSIPFTLYNEIMRLVDNFGNYLVWYNR
ncbi:MAG: hypothetical protein ACKO41_06645 [Sphingomonadales bacterium]